MTMSINDTSDVLLIETKAYFMKMLIKNFTASQSSKFDSLHWVLILIVFNWILFWFWFWIWLCQKEEENGEVILNIFWLHLELLLDWETFGGWNSLGFGFDQWELRILAADQS